MLRKLLKSLAESINSLTVGIPMDKLARDLTKQEITGYSNMIRTEDPIDAPKFCVGQLVRIRFHHHYQRHHQEVGIVTEVCDYDPIHSGPRISFYEVLVGDEKILLVERYLDGNVETEEESTEE